METFCLELGTVFGQYLGAHSERVIFQLHSTT